MGYTSARFARLFISALLITSFVPMSTAGASVRSAGSGIRAASVEMEEAVSVLDWTSYTDSQGARWVDAVVENDTAKAQWNVRVPITFTREGVAVEDERINVSVSPSVLAPGQLGTFHFALGDNANEEWEPVVGDGGGFVATAVSRELEIVSVEPIATGDESPGSADELVTAQSADPVDDEFGDVDEGTDVTGDESEAALRAYRVVVRNTSGIALTEVRVTGAEYEGVPGGHGDLLDTVAGEPWTEALPPDVTAAIEVYGLAVEDDDSGTALRTDFIAAGLETPVLTMSVSTNAPEFGASVTLVAKLSRADGTPITGSRTLNLEYSSDGEEWESVEYTTQTGSLTKTVKPTRILYLRVGYGGDDEFGAVDSDEIMIQPRAEVTQPSIAAASASRNKVLRASGLVKPDYKAGSHRVKLQCYRLEHGDWILRKTVSTTTQAYPGSFAKYTASLKLPYKGKWRVRAYVSGDSQVRADRSAYDYITIR